MNAILKEQFFHSNALYKPTHLTKINDIQQFIRNRYQYFFDTKDLAFLPSLVCQDDNNGNIETAFGFGDGIHRPFYLEQYLSSPIETIIEKIANRPIERKHIVEVGNFATLYPKNIAYELFDLLKYFNEMGYQWVSCTATRVLRVQFIRVGIQAKFISYADKNKVCQKDQEIWGKYYDTKPAVMIADIKASIKSIEKKQLNKCKTYDFSYITNGSFEASLL